MLQGAHDLHFALYDAPSGAAELWTEDHAGVLFEDGFYVVDLGAITPVDAALLRLAPDLWLSIGLDSSPALPQRLPLNGVPFAVVAGHADVASSVAGGPVDATSLTVNGSPVVAEDGTIGWASIAGAPQLLGDLGCTASAMIPLWSGSAWTCTAASNHEHSAEQITSGTLSMNLLPVGTSNNTVARGDHTHTAQDVDLGAKDPGNPLNHDRYTDGEARLATGPHYTDGDVAAYLGGPVELGPGSHIGGDKLATETMISAATLGMALEAKQDQLLANQALLDGDLASALTNQGAMQGDLSAALSDLASLRTSMSTSLANEATLKADAATSLTNQAALSSDLVTLLAAVKANAAPRWSETCKDFGPKGWSSEAECLHDGRWHLIYDRPAGAGSIAELRQHVLDGASVKVSTTQNPAQVVCASVSFSDRAWGIGGQDVVCHSPITSHPGPHTDSSSSTYWSSYTIYTTGRVSFVEEQQGTGGRFRGDWWGDAAGRWFVQF